MKILTCLTIFLLTISCVDPRKEIEDNSSPHGQVTEVQKDQDVRLPPPGKVRKNYKPGEIVVKFKDGTDQETIEAIQRTLNLKTIRVVSRGRVYLMKILDGSSVESVMQSLENYEEVQYSEPNYTRSIY
ncbi:MAG: hypothetical protein JJE15_02720 [Desulfobacteraceae bacterium]|nr:hypothetical protein [Desulfobacteraceae bacterium]